MEVKQILILLYNKIFLTKLLPVKIVVSQKEIQVAQMKILQVMQEIIKIQIQLQVKIEVMIVVHGTGVSESNQNHQKLSISPTQLTQDQKQKLLKQQALRVENQKRINNKQSPIISMDEEKIKEISQRIAIQARQAYEKVKKENSARLEKQENQEKLLNFDGPISELQRIRNSENKKYGSFRTLHKHRKVQNYQEYYFQLEENSSEDLIINLSSSSQIVYQASTFVEQNGVYSMPSKLQPVPMRLFIYENRNKIISQSQFYFIGYGYYNGLENSSYLIRFVNEGKLKLIIFKVMNNFVEESHFHNALTVQDIIKFAPRSEQIRKSIERYINDSQTRQKLIFEDTKILSKKIHRYSEYSTFQTICILLVCFCQIYMIQNLLKKGQTIV